MDIVYNNKNKVTYSMIALGDVFSWYDTIYMKTQNFLSENGAELYNAVNLSLGKGACFNDNDEVTPVKATLVVS